MRCGVVTTRQTTANWSSNFLAAYHLKENLAGAAPQLDDNTANANHCTANGSMRGQADSRAWGRSF